MSEHEMRTEESAVDAFEVHELRAQENAQDAIERLFLEEEDGGCTCVICIARVALQAAWPHLLQAAREEVTDG